MLTLIGIIGICAYIFRKKLGIESFFDFHKLGIGTDPELLRMCVKYNIDYTDNVGHDTKSGTIESLHNITRMFLPSGITKEKYLKYLTTKEGQKLLEEARKDNSEAFESRIAKISKYIDDPKETYKLCFHDESGECDHYGPNMTQYQDDADDRSSFAARNQRKFQIKRRDLYLKNKSYDNTIEDEIKEDFLKAWGGNTEYANKLYEIEKIEFEIYINGIISEFGKEKVLDVINFKPWVDLDKKTLLRIKGKPENIVDKVSRGKQREEFFYGGYKNRLGNTSYTFRIVLINGIVDGWNDIEK